MSANIKQVFDNNPSVTLPDTALVYLGLFPFNTSNDSAITGLNLKNSIVGNYLPLTGGILTGDLQVEGDFSTSYSNPGGAVNADIFNLATTGPNSHAIFSIITRQNGGGDPYLTWLITGSPNTSYYAGIDNTDDTWKIGLGTSVGTSTSASINNSTGAWTFAQTIGGNISGNAATATLASTVTTNANLTGDVTSSGNATTYNSIMPIAKGGTGANNAATTGTMLRGNGTTFVPSTTTYPDTNAINTIQYASATNVMASIAAANNGALITNGSGVPSVTVLGNLKVLGTNVSGTVAGRSISLNVVTFTSSSSYTSSTGCIGYWFEMVGGGGGGGGAGATGVSTFSAAAGGGGGEYVYGFSNTPASSVSFTVGTAGTGGIAGANNGTAGGTSTFGSITANGGQGGAGRAAVAGSSTAGALGGTGGTGGSFRFPGQPGGTGNQVASGSICSGGYGGSSRLGAGGIGTVAGAGVAATGYGAGGSGASVGASGSAAAGGNGTAGALFITEIILN
jgi:hypothetical protein